MTQYEMVEALSEKMNVSLEAAKAALEAAEWNMLDAALALEQARGNAEEAESGETCRHGGARKLREMIARGCHSRFTVRRKDAVLLELPVIVLILGLLFAFKASALLLVIGLFAGCRYSVGEQECAQSEVKTAAEA